MSTPVRGAPLRLRRFGPTAVLVEVDDAATALALATWARGQDLGAADVVPAAETVLLDGVDPDVVRDRLVGWTPAVEVPQGELVEVPVRYDGEDLPFVADVWGTTAEGVAGRLASRELVAAFCGFAPGFAYLAGLPAELAVPRLPSPRPRVRPGAVALAGPWCGIYPTESPGGWRVVGHTEVVLWDQHREPPALLAPGTRVRFVPR